MRYGTAEVGRSPPELPARYPDFNLIGPMGA
jgi:hypothetical protein